MGERTIAVDVTAIDTIIEVEGSSPPIKLEEIEICDGVGIDTSPSGSGTAGAVGGINSELVIGNLSPVLAARQFIIHR